MDNKEKIAYLESLKTHPGWRLVVEDWESKMDALQKEINVVDPERPPVREVELKVRRQIYEEAINKPEDMLSFLNEGRDQSIKSADPYE